MDCGEETYNTFALQHIAAFDDILHKACSVCVLDELDVSERQKGWFQIIRFLQKYHS